MVYLLKVAHQNKTYRVVMYTQRQTQKYHYSLVHLGKIFYYRPYRF